MHEEQELPPLPTEECSEWLQHGKRVNAFPHRVRPMIERGANDRAYWEAKGFDAAPLFTADQMREYGRQCASLAKPQPVGGALTIDQIEHEAAVHGHYNGEMGQWVFDEGGQLEAFARSLIDWSQSLATLSAPVAQPGEAVSEPCEICKLPADRGRWCSRCLGLKATSVSTQYADAAAEPVYDCPKCGLGPGLQLRCLCDATAVDLWAEIWRLREAVKGPDGYASWQDAATDERIRRVKAERALAAPAQAAAVPEAVARDAARYRHLVETCNVDFDPSEPWQLVIWEPSTGKDWKEELDADIDSAIDRLSAGGLGDVSGEGGGS
jgi:hypothetical protein